MPASPSDSRRGSWSLVSVGLALSSSMLLLVSGAAAIQLASTEAAEAPVRILPLSDTYLAEARRQLATASNATKAESLAEIDKALDLSPNRADAWLSRAYALRQIEGELGVDATNSLARSYEVAPLDPDVSLWRVRFVFEHWDSVPPNVKAAAISEFNVLWGRGAPRRHLAIIASQLRNPTGSLALHALIGAAEAEDRARRFAALNADPQVAHSK